MTAAERRLTAADFYATNRGGGLFSEAVSQHLGARIALAGHRLGTAPTTLTVVNFVLGLGVSVAAVALAGPVARGDVPAWAVGLLAGAGWQIAYAFDCADGQLARVTGRTSPAGARLDILCDVAAQIALVTALAATAAAQRPSTPAWLLAAFAGTWMVNLVTSVLQSGPQAASMVPSRSLPVRVVKLVRDYGAVIAVAGLVLALAPQWTIWLIVAFTVVNGGFLLASIAFSARASLR
ncbi:MAG TPA: CDP-alcohol phosphatidyltransferase family protein [Pilimelia sp.]|nr:CDP-alcohol phosphatidyltransferase family protein [Pilimelia sp.]